jgi:hypothetical protein
LLNGSRHIDTQYSRQGLFGVYCLACADFGIERIHAARGNANQHLI